MADDWLSLSGEQRATITEQVYLLYGNRCTHCLLLIAREDRSVEHIKPRSKGGTSEMKNLRPAHMKCNSSRGNRPLASMKAHEGLGFFCTE